MLHYHSDYLDQYVLVCHTAKSLTHLVFSIIVHTQIFPAKPLFYKVFIMCIVQYTSLSSTSCLILRIILLVKKQMLHIHRDLGTITSHLLISFGIRFLIRQVIVTCLKINNLERGENTH